MMDSCSTKLKPATSSELHFSFDLGDVFEAEFGNVGDGLVIHLAGEHLFGGG